MRIGRIFLNRLIWALCGLLFAMLTVGGAANAMELKVSDKAKLDIDVAIKYGLGMRVEKQDSALLANVNGDDGNRAFDRWAIFNNRANMTVDLDLDFGNFGVFVRPRAYFDAAYIGDTDNTSPNTFNNSPLYGGRTYYRDFDGETQDIHRDKMEFLDYFVRGNFNLGNSDLTIRVGDQVVAWGESLYYPGVSSVMGPVDATAATAPGTEVKEILMPVGQVYAVLNTPLFGISAFYQYSWEKTRLHEAGSYFSTADQLDNAGRRILIPVDITQGLAATIDRVRDEEPSDSGQYGVALRYYSDIFDGTEFGLYFINYHNKGPELRSSFSGGSLQRDWGDDTLNSLDGSSYWIGYSEDIKLYGLSLGTNVGEAYLGAEFTYRDDLPLTVRGATPLGITYVRGRAFQAQMALIYVLVNPPISDQLSFTTEFGYNKVSGYGSATLTADEDAWGGTVSIGQTYFQVLPALDLAIPVTFKWNPDGRSAIGGTFTEGADQLSIGLNFTYALDHLIGFKYVSYLGDATEDSSSDRDYLSFSYAYTF